MSTQYIGKLIVVNNTNAGRAVDNAIDSYLVTVIHTCDGEDTKVMDNVLLDGCTASSVHNFMSVSGKDDYWHFILQPDNSYGDKYEGKFKANYEERDCPGIMFVNIHWHGEVYEYDAEMVFPISDNVTGILTGN